MQASTRLGLAAGKTDWMAKEEKSFQVRKKNRAAGYQSIRWVWLAKRPRAPPNYVGVKWPSAVSAVDFFQFPWQGSYLLSLSPP